VLASEAIKFTDPENKNVYLRLRDGTRYQDITSFNRKNVLHFDQYDLQIISGDIQNTIIAYTSVEGANTLELFKGKGPKVNAELQWRLSPPISLLVLSALGVLLGKASPRSGRSVGMLIGIVIFMLYNNGLLIAKNSVERGELDQNVGLWGVHLLAIMLTFVFYQLRNKKISGHLVKISTFINKNK